jgi:hypothetical protein
VEMKAGLESLIETYEDSMVVAKRLERLRQRRNQHNDRRSH